MLRPMYLHCVATVLPNKCFRPLQAHSSSEDNILESPSSKRQRTTLDSAGPSKTSSLLRTPSFSTLPSRKTTKVRPKKSAPAQQKTLTQLHFVLDQSVMRTCPQCGLSYTKAAPDDETLHRAHCARVRKGMEWGREEEREREKAGVVEIESVAWRTSKGKTRGRIVCFKADVGGKIGSKLATLLDTINLALSSPPLTKEILAASKVYLFLQAPEVAGAREKIAGCVIAQRIETAMEIATPEEVAASSPKSSPGTPPTATMVAVDTSTGLFCHSTQLPTPMGIPRLFVPSSHRRMGIASRLLDAACRTFIYNCHLDPRKGEVAFTQPTGDGAALIRGWGGGKVRIYEE
ncbi:hypothetical protein HDZ31DRAFT_81500 [Schizophyllum fasciatum]